MVSYYYYFADSIIKTKVKVLDDQELPAAVKYTCVSDVGLNSKRSV